MCTGCTWGVHYESPATNDEHHFAQSCLGATRTSTAAILVHTSVGNTIMYLLLLLTAVALLVGVLAVIGKLPRLRTEWAIPLLVAAWTLLVLAGTLASGGIIRLAAVPVAAMSITCFAVLDTVIPRRPRFAVYLYWIGVCLTTWGALHTGLHVWMLNAIAQQYQRTYYLRTLPNTPRELAIWCVPAILLWLGAILRSRFGRTTIVASGILLLLLNPLVLVVGRWLSLPLDM